MLIVNQDTMDDFRFERKFFITGVDFHVIESIVKHHPAIFTMKYPPRYINSIYLDTPALSSYNDNILGTSERLKTRIRWYGDLFGHVEKPVLELKYKKAHLGTKMKYDLRPFEFNNSYSRDYQHEIFARSNLPEKLFEYLKQLQPLIIIRYYRKYYESCDHKFRITLDRDVQFYRVHSASNLFLEHIVDRNNFIVELKCKEGDGDQLELISNQLPFRLTKSSKYVSGIVKLYQ